MNVATFSKDLLVATLHSVLFYNTTYDMQEIYTTVGLLYEHPQHFVNNNLLCRVFPLIKNRVGFQLDNMVHSYFHFKFQ